MSPLPKGGEKAVQALLNAMGETGRRDISNPTYFLPILITHRNA